MPILTCRALLFDMDGVLLSSTAAVERVWRQWALEHELDPAHVAHLSHGRRSIETLRELLPLLSDDAHQFENLEVERREMEDRDGVGPISGARELLASLPLDRWAVVTSATRPLAEVRLRYAGLPVPANLITAEMVVNGKPHPEPYLRGAELLGLAPAECIVLEDVAAGIHAAKSAGMRVIALTTTVFADQLAEADCIVQDLTALRVKVEAEHLVVSC